MASYYLSGYLPPEGVHSSAMVKQYQEQLGVKADGIWGPVTQAAYEQSLLNSVKDAYVDPWSVPPSGSQSSLGVDRYSDYYSTIMDSLRVPYVSVDIPSRKELETDIAASIRPSVDLAIDNRRDAAQTNMAELDADAAARGMGSSTYVTSVKGREMQYSERDIALMESSYAAALAERVASALQYYTGLKAQADMQNAQLSMTAQLAAMNNASQWYTTWATSQGAPTTQTAVPQTSSSKSSSSSSSKSTSTLTAEDYAAYEELMKNRQNQSSSTRITGGGGTVWAMTK